MLAPRQQFLYQHRGHIWRASKAKTGSKMTGMTYTQVEASVPIYFETGQSQKGLVQFVQSESDNLFTLDTLHMEQGVNIRAGDWIQQSVGPQAGEWWQARGDVQVRKIFANKQKILCARMSPPEGLEAVAP